MGRDFDGCLFKRCRFPKGVLDRCRFLDCRFESCDLSLADPRNSRWRSVSFHECKLTGVGWSRAAALAFLEFHRCKLDYAVFAGLDLRRLKLTECAAFEADFAEADLTKAVLTGTDFRGARFARTNLQGADLRGALNYAIDPALNPMQGAKVSLPEAVALLRGLGLVLD